MSAVAGRAYSGRTSYGWKNLPSPTALIIDSATPHRGFRINCQMNPMMTTESIVGIKSIVR